MQRANLLTGRGEPAIFQPIFIVSRQRSSVGKESACYAGDPSSVPGLGRSPGEGIGSLLQFSWGSLVAQPVKNQPAMLETWVRSLGWGDTWSREKLPTSVFWPGEFHGLYSPWGHKELDTTEQPALSLSTQKIPAGSLALGDGVGRYSMSRGWAFLPSLGSG